MSYFTLRRVRNVARPMVAIGLTRKELRQLFAQAACAWGHQLAAPVFVGYQLGDDGRSAVAGGHQRQHSAARARAGYLVRSIKVSTACITEVCGLRKQ